MLFYFKLKLRKQKEVKLKSTNRALKIWSTQDIEASAKEKDLGVIIHSSLFWNEQMKTSVSNPNQMICWVVSNLIDRDENVMPAIHKALIRPNLEYCVQ